MLDEDTANQFKDVVLKPILIANIAQYGIIALGAALLICALIVTTITIVQQRKVIHLTS